MIIVIVILIVVIVKMIMIMIFIITIIIKGGEARQLDELAQVAAEAPRGRRKGWVVSLRFLGFLDFP